MQELSLGIRRARSVDDRLVSLKEIKARLRVTHPTIYRWIQLSGFPEGVTLGGRTRRWWLSDVDDWITSQQTPSRIQPNDAGQAVARSFHEASQPACDGSEHSTRARK